MLTGLTEKIRRSMPVIVAMVVGIAACYATLTYEMPDYTTNAEVKNTAPAAAAQIKLPDPVNTEEIATRTATNPKGSKSLSAVKDPGNYKDGTYRGKATGFNGDITVEVTIKNGKISSIKIVSSSDDQPYFGKAKAVISKIIKKQSTNVDTVSGATYSSVGIIKAVRNALKKAASSTKNDTNNEDENTDENTDNQDSTDTGDTDDEDNDTPGTDDNPGDQDSQSDKDSDSGSVIDGDYTQTVICSPDIYEDFNDYNVTVTVTISDKKIVSLNLVSMTGTSADKSFLNSALKNFTKQLNNGGKTGADDFDVVSGATCSSKALIEACRQALESASKLNTTGSAGLAKGGKLTVLVTGEQDSSSEGSLNPDSSDDQLGGTDNLDSTISTDNGESAVHGDTKENAADAAAELNAEPNKHACEQSDPNKCE